MSLGIPGIIPEIVFVQEYDQSSIGELYNKQILILLNNNKKKRLLKSCEGEWYIRRMSKIESRPARIYITSDYTSILIFNNIRIYLNMKRFHARSNNKGWYSISSLQTGQNKVCLLSLSSKIKQLEGYILER